jgi:ankyrin repeat protein
MLNFVSNVGRRRVAQRPVGLWITISILLAGIWCLPSTPADLHNAFQVAALSGDEQSLGRQWTLRAEKGGDGEDLCAALRLAACLGHESIVAQLLDWGVDPNCKSPGGRTPLMYAIGAEHSAEIARRLMAAGADVKVLDRDGKNVLQEAAEQHDDAMLAFLRGKGL